MMALLLSAVLTAVTALGTAPLNVLAQENAGEGYNQTQESVSGNEVTEEETGAESDGEEMETVPAEGESGETEKPVENLVTEESGGEAEQKPAAEDEEAGAIDETDGQPDEAAAPQKVMRTAGVAAQADGDVSGDGWVLDADGTLTIESDAGMSDWVSYKTDNYWDVAECVTIVNILSDVTNIGDAAFCDCFKLTTITIPASVERIGAEALASCESLDRVVMLGSTPPTLGTYENKGAHFEGCGFVTDNLKGIKVPEGTTAVYKAAWPDWADYITDGSASEVEIIASGTGWTFDSNGKLTIESDEGLAAWNKDGYSANRKKIRTVELLENVTKIVFNSFSECSRLAAITIPSSVTEIERYTFVGDALTNITIPAGVTSIGESAFMNCSGLESVTVLGEDPATIGSGIFEDCKFVTDDVKGKGIKVPEGTVAVYKEAWPEWADYITDGLLASGTDWTLDADGKLTIKSDAGMTNWCSLRTKLHFHPYDDQVTAIEIQDGVTGIGEEAFLYCSKLTAVTLPDSVQSIGKSAFNCCRKLTSITIPDGVTGIEEKVFAYCDILTDIKIPTSVTSIGPGAFTDCTGLTSIKLPDGVVSIEKEAFSGCTGLTSIRIPEKVTSLDDYVFSDCSSLTSIEIPSTVISIGRYAFEGCTDLTHIEIPATVTSIEGAAFGNCTNLAGVTFAQGIPITEIAPDLFAGCTSLKHIKLPSGVTKIGYEAFYGCTNLTNIELPSGVTDIESTVFCECSSLTEITIPSSVKNIGAMAFYNCSSLDSVTMEGSTPPALGVADEETGETYLFPECKFVTDSTKGIKVPVGSVEAYKTAWPEWADYITDGSESEETIIASGTDWTLDSNGKLTIKSDEGMNDWFQFHYVDDVNTKVTSAEIKDGVTSIPGDESSGHGAFKDCSKLRSITIPSSVTEIGDYAFYECSKLTDIKLPAELTAIGRFAFCMCGDLTDVELPASVQKIGMGAFDSCSSLVKVTFLSDTTAIGEYAFSGCSSLAGIELPAGLIAIETGTFSRCSSLTSITIPSGVTSIGPNVFLNCSSLESVTMEGSTPPTLAALESGRTAHFSGCKFVTDGTQGIKVPAGTADTYKAEWAEWKDYIVEGSAPAEPTDQEKVEAAKKAVEDVLAGIHMSNATTKESLEADLKAAVKAALDKADIDSKDVTISVENFTKTEATTAAPGSIKADIRITSGTESAAVTVDQTINKLPGTPADKVAAVKTAVENAVKKAIDEALAGTKVTNDNAEEIAEQIAGLIPEAVARALEAAGVGADEVAIGDVDIQVEPATADSEGSIKVAIPVTSTEDAGQSGSAVIQMPVTKPGGEEDPDKEAEAVQKAVEDALQNITITNEITPEEIRDALQEALGDDASVEDVEELEKVEATQDAPGKLTLKIKVVINGKTIYVTVNVPIAQLSRKTGVYVRFTDYYDIDGTTPRYKYTGLAVKPAVEVYHNETLLTLGKDYTIGYKNNIKAGSAAALTVKGKGSFSGTSEAVNFTIINADIDQDTDHPTEMTVVVNTKVAPVIMNGTKKLNTKDYILEGDGLKNGKYASATAEGTPNILTVKGINNYAGSSFTINVTVVEKKAAGKLAVKVDKNFKPVYDGNAINLSILFKHTLDGEGAITVTDSKDKTKLLKEGTDFTVVCTSSLVNAGTVKFTLTGMGAYTGSVSKTFKISPLKVTDRDRFAVTFDENKAYEYKAAGAAVDDLVVKYLGETDSDTDDKILIPGVDYKVTYSNHKKVSTKKDASLKITFLGNYKGSSAVSRTFKVVTAKLSAHNTVVTVPDKVYSKAKRAYKSTPIVTVDGVTIKSSNYTVSYAWATGSEAEDDTKYIADNKVKITIADGDTWAKVKVTVTPKETGSYGLAEGAVLEGAYYVRRIDSATNLSKAKVTFYNKEGTRLKTLEYNGSTFYTPAGNNAEADDAPDDPNAVYVRVTVGGAVVDPGLYDVIWTNATAKGKATVVIRGKGTATDKGMAVGSKNQAITIKAMGLKGKTLKSYVENAVSSLKNIFSLIQ